MARITTRKRHMLRKSQVEDLFRRLKEEIGDSAALFSEEGTEIVETDADLTIYLIGKKPLLMETKGVVFPTLRGLLERPFPERKVVVDSGAVPFVVKGADVMRPGVTAISPDVRAGRPVQVVEERHGKPLAVGIALFDAAGMKEQEKGKVVRTFHFVGDEVWALEL
ncbi:MAG: RNA-binding protein [Methanolinea sp.]|nr:RNA-binding protein [Methanolinea sp.]